MLKLVGLTTHRFLNLIQPFNEKNFFKNFQVIHYLVGPITFQQPLRLYFHIRASRKEVNQLQTQLKWRIPDQFDHLTISSETRLATKPQDGECPGLHCPHARTDSTDIRRAMAQVSKMMTPDPECIPMASRKLPKNYIVSHESPGCSLVNKMGKAGL